MNKFNEEFRTVYAPYVLVAFGILVLLAGFQTEIFAQGYNYDHVNVTTTVNVTNARPEILNIWGSGTPNITLNAGGQTVVQCNTSIRDYNGFGDIDVVNGTFYYEYNDSIHTDDGNEHYTNGSCAQVQNDGQYIGNYTCTFSVEYFAYNGTWFCNVTANDSFAFEATEANSTAINPLYALNVTDVIDYGNLSVTETSENVTATITNFGNTELNVSVKGFGRVEGDLWGLVCSQGTNITVENQRFSNALVDWGSKTPLNETDQDLDITMLRQTNDVVPVTNDTYWQLYVLPNPFGICNGTVMFTARLP